MNLWIRIIIKIVAKVDLNNKMFEILKTDEEFECLDLFNQLILYNKIKNLTEYLDGQIMPRMWGQGNSKCIISRPNDNQVIAMFYESTMDAKENYFFAKKIDSLVKEVFWAQNNSK